MKILELRDQFEGLIFCDYTNDNFSCKPEPEYYTQVRKPLGASCPTLAKLISDL